MTPTMNTMIDATIVRAHQHSAGAKKKSAKTQAKTRRSTQQRRMSTKIHVVVRCLGQIDCVHLTPDRSTIWSVPMNVAGNRSENRARRQGYDADARVIEPCGRWPSRPSFHQKNRKEPPR